MPCDLSGVGGDEVFFNGAPLLSLADYVHERGLDSEFIPAALGVSRLTGLSVWKALYAAIAGGCGSRPRWNPLIGKLWSDPLINREAVEPLLDLGSYRSSWFSRDQYVPPGKQFQICFIERYNSNMGSLAMEEMCDPEPVHPLLSQPLVELCLRIPTYLSMYGGQDRAIARQAFSTDVPKEILERRWKGIREDYTAEMFRRNADFMRDTLLNGRLVAAGLLHRSRLQSALSAGPSGGFRGMHVLSRYLAIELWFRHMGHMWRVFWRKTR